MNENRYTRQIQLREFGPKAQQKLSEARILVVGVGGLGIPVLQYLNAMGVGTLGVVEQDIIEKTNLHRQVLFAESDVGKPKVMVAVQKLKEQNSQTHFVIHDTFLVKDNALDIIDKYDIVVDASDNFATRYLVNDACVILNKPFIYGALHGFEGQLSVFNFEDGPTYRCLFPVVPSFNEVPDCNELGVLGVLPGIIGNLQALEAVKLITGVGELLSGQLMIYNGLNNTVHKIGFAAVAANKELTSLADEYELIYCDPSYIMSPQEMQEALDANMGLILIDVRSQEEFNNYHLPGSLNIPLSRLEFQEYEISVNDKICLVCQSGIRSLKALHWLKDRGHKNELFNLSGGINAYHTLIN